MSRPAALILALGAFLMVMGLCTRCARAEVFPQSYEASSAKAKVFHQRKAKRWRKARRYRVAFRPRPAARPVAPTVMAAIPPVDRIERAHQEVPARFLGADIMQPVRAEYIALASFAAIEPSDIWPMLEREAPAGPWQQTAGGKASIVAAFLAFIAACGLGNWRARHG